jgi:hypothetical protein
MRSVEVTTYSGPLPHPNILERFEQIHPGAAGMIFEDFLLQSNHRRKIESSVVRAIVISDIAGTFAASLIGLPGVGGGLWLAHEGRPLGGLSSIFGTLATLLGVFLYQNRKPGNNPQHPRNKELRDPE